MKKNIKNPTFKLATLFIALSTSVVLTACNGDEEDDGVALNNSTTTTTTTTSTPSSNTTTTQTQDSSTSTPTPNPNPTPNPTPTPSAGSLGKTAWNNNCQSCHGGSTSKGLNASKTMAAISANTGGMGILNGKVSADDANNIAAYAANPGAY